MIIDLSNIRTIEALHDNLKRELKFPAFYGDNWDALWDVLIHTKELPPQITLLGYSQFEARFPEDGKSFSRLIDEYNNHWSLKGKRQYISVV